jgi:hypothetical protein
MLGSKGSNLAVRRFGRFRRLGCDGHTVRLMDTLLHSHDACVSRQWRTCHDGLMSLR